MSACASADSLNSFFVYIVRCADDFLYIGHTSDIEARIDTHNEGRGAVWTAHRRPVVLIYRESHGSEQQAVARDRQLKRWTQAKKLALIRGDVKKIKSLAKRQTTRSKIQRDSQSSIATNISRQT